MGGCTSTRASVAPTVAPPLSSPNSSSTSLLNGSRQSLKGSRHQHLHPSDTAASRTSSSSPHPPPAQLAHDTTFFTGHTTTFAGPARQQENKTRDSTEAVCAAPPHGGEAYADSGEPSNPGDSAISLNLAQAAASSPLPRTTMGSTSSTAAGGGAGKSGSVHPQFGDAATAGSTDTTSAAAQPTWPPTHSLKPHASNNSNSSANSSSNNNTPQQQHWLGAGHAGTHATSSGSFQTRSPHLQRLVTGKGPLRSSSGKELKATGSASSSSHHGGHGAGSVRTTVSSSQKVSHMPQMTHTHTPN